MEQEPINTTLPWARKRREPITMVDAERAAYEKAARRAMTEPGNGAIHPMSITTPTYEPNRAMAPEPNDIIAKKGKRQPGYNKVVVTTGDKVVVFACLACASGIVGIVAALLSRLG